MLGDSNSIQFKFSSKVNQSKNISNSDGLETESNKWSSPTGEVFSTDIILEKLLSPSLEGSSTEVMFLSFPG